jgi:dUTP pyrophosphatase
MPDGLIASRGATASHTSFSANAAEHARGTTNGDVVRSPPMPPALIVRIRRLPSSSGLDLPTYMTSGSAGMDLYAAVDDEVTIEAGGIVLVPTGLEVAIPEGFEGQVRPRSGLAVKHGISLPNTPATIDSDYRGEIRVPLINLGREPFRIGRGMRIAQLVVAPVARVTWDEVPELPATTRGPKGFGHSGV